MQKTGFFATILTLIAASASALSVSEVIGEEMGPNPNPRQAEVLHGGMKIFSDETTGFVGENWFFTIKMPLPRECLLYFEEDYGGIAFVSILLNEGH